VDVRPFQDQEDVVSGFLEVFKYAVKFADLPLDDNWVGYETLKGRNLVFSLGAFRGVDVPESLADEELADEPYMQLIYRFARGAGYSLERHVHFGVPDADVLPMPLDDSSGGACSEVFPVFPRKTFGENAPTGASRPSLRENPSPC